MEPQRANVKQIKVHYIKHMGDDLTAVNAARVSFGNEKTELDEKDKKLINYLAKHEHMSPFEHQVLTIKVEVPLYIRSQMMRHRTFSYNEISRRYTDKDLEFYIPDTFRKQHKSNRQASEGELSEMESNIAQQKFYMAHESMLDDYRYLTEVCGVCREQARGILPQNLMTEFIMTGNLRNYAHFIKLREHEGAQAEVQEVAEQIRNIIIDKFGYTALALLEKK